jgi:predicted neuraminidase
VKNRLLRVIPAYFAGMADGKADASLERHADDHDQSPQPTATTSSPSRKLRGQRLAKF